MSKIERRAAMALGLFGGGAAAAFAPFTASAQPQQAAPRLAERLYEARFVLSFAAEPEAVRRWVPEGWEPLPLPAAGPWRGSLLFLAFSERIARLGPEGVPGAPVPQRVATLTMFVRAAGGGSEARTGFAYVCAWMPAEAARDWSFGAVRAAAIAREASERGSVEDGPAQVREAWTLREAEGGAGLRMLLEYRRANAPLRALYDLRVISAATVRPAVEQVYRVDRVLDVLRSEGADDRRLARFEIEAAAGSGLREALGGAEPRPLGIFAEPVSVRDLPVA